MNEYFLLYWIFQYLKDNHPDVFEDMKENFNNEKWAPKSTQTRKQTLISTIERMTL